MAEPMFIVHATGTRPHGIDIWTKPYRNLPTAVGQAARVIQYGMGRGDWRATVYRIDPDPAPSVTYRLVPVQEVRADA